MVDIEEKSSPWNFNCHATSSFRLKEFYLGLNIDPILQLKTIQISCNSCKSFHATDHLLYSLETSENLLFSGVFRGYMKTSVVWNGLTIFLIGVALVCYRTKVWMRHLLDLKIPFSEKRLSQFSYAN